MGETAKNKLSAAGGRKGGVAWAKNVGAFLPKVTRPAFEKFGFPAAALVTDWGGIAGADLASYTMPEKLTWPRVQEQGEGELEPGPRGREAGATLVLRVEGPRALEVQFKTQQIMERINTYFGYRAVTAIRIAQAPLKRAETKEIQNKRPVRNISTAEVEKIENERLRAALSRLAEGVARR